MLNRVIDFFLDNRWTVIFVLGLILWLGIQSLRNIAIDAFPDLTPNQVTVLTEAPGLPPVEVEQLVTYPIETAMMGLPATEQVRSLSKLGLSMVIVTFEDGVDTYLARQWVTERLNEARERLPDGILPRLGPVATAFGEVYQYTVEGSDLDAMQRKTLHDWQIRNELRGVAGVSEVNTWGGFTRQIEIVVEPQKLFRYGLTLDDIFNRVAANNQNFSGGFIEHSGEQYTIRGLGRATAPEDLARIVLYSQAGRQVLLKDVAEIRSGAMPRQGAVIRGGQGETVSGMVIMLKGGNSKEIIDRVKDRITQMRLPGDTRIVPFYDQSEVIDGAIHTVRTNLFEGGLLVVLILLLFLGNVKAALVVASVIPLSMLIGFFGMDVFGISANLMSLGAIDFGLIVDGAVVMMENSVRKMHDPHLPAVDRRERIRAAAHEVSRPIAFAVAIIIAVYIPIFTLEGLEGRMFKPMAITVCTALLASLILALTVIPVAASLVLKTNQREKEQTWMSRLEGRYRRLLHFVLHHRAPTLALSLLIVALAAASIPFLGSEFMPRLDEGSLLVQAMTLPGVSLENSVEANQRVQRVILSFPEVTGAVTKLGRPDLATEAMGVYESDVYVLLKPEREWSSGRSQEDLIAAMAERLEQVPGLVFNFTQPMAMRLDEVVSGIKADVALKIFGEDPAVLERLAASAAPIIESVQGSADVRVEAISGAAELRIQIDRGALARYGLNVEDVRHLVESATGGWKVTEFLDGQRRFDVVLRLPEQFRADPRSIRGLTLTAPGGERVALNQIARITQERGPELVARENGQRRIVVQSNVRGRDLGSFVAELQERIQANLALPAGYSLEWGGQFENQQRATRRLLLVIPATILIIFGLLFANFHSLRNSLLILLIVPFALVGGVGALWLRGMNINLSASIGFIALFGIAVMQGIVMVSYINALLARGHPLQEAVIEGAVTRLRPVLMTSLVASLGFVPMALATSTGAEVQRPLATVVVGGLISSTLLTLVLLPVLYPWFRAPLPEPIPEQEPLDVTA